MVGAVQDGATAGCVIAARPLRWPTVQPATVAPMRAAWLAPAARRAKLAHCVRGTARCYWRRRLEAVRPWFLMWCFVEWGEDAVIMQLDCGKFYRNLVALTVYAT